MPAGVTTPHASSIAIRDARPEDREAIAAIQQACPEAGQWDAGGYDTTVAELDGRIAGFLVIRDLGEGESEILNLAVAPTLRRLGVARALLLPALRGSVFLEVRESNQTARKFYNSLGFQEVARRPGYYGNPPETGIVMKFHSC